MITTTPNTSFEALLTGAPSGTHWWVTLKDGQGGVILARSDTGIVEEAPGVYTATRTAPAVEGTYTLVWDDGTRSLAEQVTVTTAAYVPSGQLCSLTDVKRADQALTNAGTTRDTHIQSLIMDATGALQDHVGRQLLAGVGLETRVYPAASTIHMDLSAPPALVEWAATPDGPRTVLTDSHVGPWDPRPGDPFSWITTTRSSGVIAVTAVFGFPTVPPAVRRACVRTVIHWLRMDRSLTAPSPDQWAPGEPPQRALPLEAMDLLRPYRIPVVA